MKAWPIIGLLAVAACGEPIYWEPDLTGFECSKTRTCDLETEGCFEGSCVPKCTSDDDCDDGDTCEPVIEGVESWRTCFGNG